MEYIFDAHAVVSKYANIRVNASNLEEAQKKALTYIEDNCEDLKTVPSEHRYIFLPAKINLK